MKVFLDTEFYEFQPTHRGVERQGMAVNAPGANAVQLISIGAVREDGAEFYAENASFNWDHVPNDHWLQDNVRPHLWNEKYLKGTPLWLSSEGARPAGGFYTPKEIAQGFYEFACTYALHPSGVATPENVRPEFWGYFCDYDWVVLCGLYGRMIDLPPEFPMFCRDLKQEMARMDVKRVDLPTQPDDAHHALADARWIRDAYNFLPGDEMSKSDLHE